MSLKFISKVLWPQRIHVHTKCTRFSSAAHPLTIQIPNFHKTFYSASFFPRTARLWNSLPSDCFPSNYDLQSFKSNVNQYLSVFVRSVPSLLLASCLVVAFSLAESDLFKIKKNMYHSILSKRRRIPYKKHNNKWT